MAFPSTLSALTNPQATDKLNSPSHSGIEQAQNAAIEQIEAVIGVEGSASVVGSLEYFIKSPDSNGGGHIQTANKGGTGQTTYTKGDILVATSSSVVAKLAVGGDGQTLVANSSTASGMNWTTAIGNRVVVKSSFFSYVSGQTSTAAVLFSTSILGSTIGVPTGSAIKFIGVIERLDVSNTRSITFRVLYGNNSIISAQTNSVLGEQNLKATIEGGIISSTFGTQQGYFKLNTSSPGSMFGVVAYGTSSVESSANQALSVTAQYDEDGSPNAINGRIFIVEKIT